MFAGHAQIQLDGRCISVCLYTLCVYVCLFKESNETRKPCHAPSLAISSQTEIRKLRGLIVTDLRREFAQLTVAAATGGWAFCCVICNRFSQQLSFTMFKLFGRGQASMFSELFESSSSSFSPLFR